MGRTSIAIAVVLIFVGINVRKRQSAFIIPNFGTIAFEVCKFQEKQEDIQRLTQWNRPGHFFRCDDPFCCVPLWNNHDFIHVQTHHKHLRAFCSACLLNESQSDRSLCPCTWREPPGLSPALPGVLSCSNTTHVVIKCALTHRCLHRLNSYIWTRKALGAYYCRTSVMTGMRIHLCVRQEVYRLRCCNQYLSWQSVLYMPKSVQTRKCLWYAFRGELLSKSSGMFLHVSHTHVMYVNVSILYESRLEQMNLWKWVGVKTAIYFGGKCIHLEPSKPRAGFIWGLSRPMWYACACFFLSHAYTSYE